MDDLLIAHGFQGPTLMSLSPFQVYTATHPGCPKGIGMHEIKISALPATTGPQQTHQASFLETLQSHPNVCTFCQSFIFILDEKRRLAIVTEWGGKNLMKDTADRCKHKYPWPEEEFIRVAGDIIKALAHVERHSILHRPVHPSNIYCRTNPHTVKLGNFSSAIPLVGTLEERFMVQSEVYSLGLTLLAIASLEPGVMELHGEANAPMIQQKVARLSYNPNVKFMLGEMLRFDFDIPISFAYLEDRYSRPPGVSQRPSSPFSNVLIEPTTSDGADDPVVAHREYQCCTEKLTSTIPVELRCPSIPVELRCSSSASLSFCQMDCYAKFIEKATRDFTQMEIKCPVCQGTIREEEVNSAFGNNLTNYKQKSFKKGILCVRCNEATATHTIECGHLYCKSCLKLHSTWYSCASCRTITNTDPMPLDPEPGLLRRFLCGGNFHVSR